MNAIRGFFPDKKPKHRTRRCKFCGEPGLKWAVVVKRWRLVDEEGFLHECPEYAEARQRAEQRWLNELAELI